MLNLHGFRVYDLLRCFATRTSAGYDPNVPDGHRRGLFFTLPLFGALSERIGRELIMASVVLMALFAFPYF